MLPMMFRFSQYEISSKKYLKIMFNSNVTDYWVRIGFRY